MSRGGASRAGPIERAGTPIWVWVVYGLGILGAVALIGSAVASAVMILVSDASVNISFPALAVCLVLVGAAVAVKVRRTRAAER